MSSHGNFRLVPLWNSPGPTLRRESFCVPTLISSSQYTTDGKIKEPDYLAGAQDDLLAAGASVLRGDSGGLFKGLMNVAKGAFDAQQSHAKAKKDNTSTADVIQWSGCKDDQTVSLLKCCAIRANEQSADTVEAGKSTGAMSYVS